MEMFKKISVLLLSALLATSISYGNKHKVDHKDAKKEEKVTMVAGPYAYSTFVGGTGISNATVPKGMLLIGNGTANSLTGVASGADGQIFHYDASATGGIAKSFNLFDNTLSPSLNSNTRQGIANDGTSAVFDWSAPRNIKLGFQAGLTSQGNFATAVGTAAGSASQGVRATAIGFNASPNNQPPDTVSIGSTSSVTGLNSTAIGGFASDDGFSSSIALGNNATNTANNQAILPSGVHWSLDSVNDLSGLASADFDTRQLFWTDGTTVVFDWSDQSISDENGGMSIRWFDRQLFDASGPKAMDWDSRQGFANDGNTPTIQWGTQQLFDNTGTLSEDWNIRALYGNDGTSVVIDWDGQQLIDTAGFGALLWSAGARQLYDDAGNLAANFTTVQRELYDASSNKSFDFGLRQAVANDGTTAKIDYSDPDFTNFYTVQGLEFQVAAGAAPVINYFSVNGAPTGNTPIMNSFGGDTDVGMTFQTQGAGSIDFTSGSGGLFLLANPGGTIANNFIMFAGNTGVSPTLAATGTDTDVDLNLTAQGAGIVYATSPFRSPSVTTSDIFDESSAAEIHMATGGVLDSTGTDSLNFNTRALFDDTGGGKSVDWLNHILNDYTGPLASVAWDARHLLGTDGTTRVLDWNGPLAKILGLQVVEGASGSRQGAATLVGGTVTVSTTAVTANSRIFLTAQDNNCVGALKVSARSAGANFTISSPVITDTCLAAWIISEPA